MKSTINNETFITIWYESTDPADAARRMGISRQSVYSRAKYLRDRGVKLAPHPKGQSHQKLSAEHVAELNKLSEQLRKEKFNGNVS